MPKIPLSCKRLTTAAAVATLTLALGACALGSAPPQRSALMVDTAASSLRFVSVKAGAAGAGGIVEVHRFDRFKGGLDAKGTIWLDIDLASVHTGIDIRDERLRTLLFDVAASPSATFTAQIDPAKLDALRENGSLDLDLTGHLQLTGQRHPLQAALRVTRLSAGSLQVATRAPIVVDAQAFGLKAGVEALRQVMGLNFLATAAPVTLNMVLHAPG